MPAHTPELSTDLENADMQKVTLNAKLAPKDEAVDGAVAAAHDDATDVVGKEIEI